MTDKQLTDPEILELCARACDYPYKYWEGSLHWPVAGFALLDSSGTPVSDRRWNPLTDDGDCARMENKCDVAIERNTVIGTAHSVIYTPLWRVEEAFTPGNDAERRRASCLVVARAQLAKEKA